MLHRYIKILVISVFVALSAVQAGKSFVLDEIDFPIVSHATSISGKPIYYRGETAPTHVGTYHPTLYINSLAAFIKAFGFNETTVRFFGIICTLISAYLLVLILRRLIKKSETAEVLLLAIFLLNPYTIANTMLPDIDSTVLPVVILLFIYYSVRYLLPKKNTSNRVVLILGSLFALALWSKLTTPLIIPPFLACLAFITLKDYRKSILFTIKVTLLGIAIFLVSYFLYCKLLGLSTSYTYHFLIESFTKGTDSEGPVVGALHNLASVRTFIFWPTIPVVFLFLVSFIGVMFTKAKNTQDQVKKLLVMTGSLVTFFYIALIAPFGGFFKYPFAVFGLLVLTIVFFYDRYLRGVKINPIYAFLVAAFGFMIERIIWKDAMFLNGQPFRGLILILFLAIVSFLLLKKYSGQRLVASVAVLFIFFCIGFQVSISRIQAVAPYPTRYLYGQMGLDQTTAYLRSNTNPDEAIWSMKDVGYYTHNKYYENYGYFFDESLQSDLINMLQDSKVKYYVVTAGIGQDNIQHYTDIKKILDDHAVKEKQYGNFIIYKSKE